MRYLEPLTECGTAIAATYIVRSYVESKIVEVQDSTGGEGAILMRIITQETKRSIFGVY
jgi:hypothetical protein